MASTLHGDDMSGAHSAVMRDNDLCPPLLPSVPGLIATSIHP